MTQETWEERWDIYCNGEIVDPIPFFRTEIQKAREEERERIISLLDDDVKILLHNREAEIGQMNLEINQEDK